MTEVLIEWAGPLAPFPFDLSLVKLSFVTVSVNVRKYENKSMKSVRKLISSSLILQHKIY